MCAAISSRLFKINDQIKCDQAINSVEHEMFADGNVLHEAPAAKCIAVKFNPEINSTRHFASKITSFSDIILENEKRYDSNQSTLKQINFAVDFIQKSTQHDTFYRFSLIKTESVVVPATSGRSLFETLVSIHYAAVAFRNVSVILDERRAYLKELLVPMFHGEETEVDCPNTGGKPSFCTQIIFDSADSKSAFNVLAAALNDTTSPWKIRSCWIQDTLKTEFMNSFQSFIWNARQLTDEENVNLENIVTNSKQYDATVIQSKDKNATFLVDVTKRHIDSDLCVVVNFFRTAKEVVSLVHATDATNSVSLWSESISLAFDVADKLKVANVWINSNGLLHPQIPFTFGSGAEQHVYGSKMGIAQMFKTKTKQPNSSEEIPYSAAVTVTGKYNFQTTSTLKIASNIDDNNPLFESADAELKNLIDVSQTNNFKTICFPFGQIFAN
ncbi:Aldehyde dehydrogenase family 16 member A1 [Pseudolycoriella hygida]|uniref:Aldehyde dehydrogenase family 16 member A1 n=1 Tax=Pseudolycoriella hygida TaxID=35572 RepID=A0A9Q0N4N6_9DIPT|nr:Aldehyde dehydrogenase family 16 member A1 [Pseudolycoriella hygida]